MRFAAAILSAAFVPAALANMLPPMPPPVTVEMYSISDKGAGAKIGTIELKQTPMGLMLLPDLKTLPPGARGFHVHEKGNCGPATKDGKSVAGLSAGPHFDPDGHGKHLGPKGQGHRGDLETLTVAADGTAKFSILSNRLKLKDIAGRSLIIHAGGDNYSDAPEPLGGGGARIACGVVPVKWDGFEPKDQPDELVPAIK
jgi:Cu-Zn family superoxide dismutase